MTNKKELKELNDLSNQVEEYLAENQMFWEDLEKMPNPGSLWGVDDATLWRARAVGDFITQVYEANEGEGNFSRDELLDMVRIAF